MRKLFDIYVRPILEYGSVIWSSNNEYIALEATLKKSTRFMLQTPYNNNDINYIDFNTRLTESNRYDLYVQS